MPSRVFLRAIVVALVAAGVVHVTGSRAAQAVPAGRGPVQALAAPDVAGCVVRFEQSPNGYVAHVTVTGPGVGWSIPFTMPTGQRVVQVWHASVAVSGQNGTASNLSWNGNLGAGQSVGFGLVAIRPSGDTGLLTFPTCAMGT